MHEPKVTSLALPRLSVVCLKDIKVEQCVIVAAFELHLVSVDSCKLLIGWHSRRSNIVRQEESVAFDMAQLDNVLVADNATATGFRERFGGDDLPVVVQVSVGIASDLLT